LPNSSVSELLASLRGGAEERRELQRRSRKGQAALAYDRRFRARDARPSASKLALRRRAVRLDDRRAGLHLRLACGQAGFITRRRSDGSRGVAPAPLREHSAIQATGSSWERTPWRAVQLGAGDILTKSDVAA
jgi:hypothetical protein